MNNFSHLLSQALPDWVLQQSQSLVLLARYLELLQHWNKAYNLTAIREPQDMVIRLILDSLSVADYMVGERVLDVGTGAGLPGIVLAIVQPFRQFTLLDSNGKKIRFLQHVVAELALSNIEVIQARIEKWQPAGCFHTIVSRAFARIAQMLEITQHVGCNEVRFIAMKGIYPQEELEEISKAFKLCAIHPIAVPGLNAERHIVHIEFNH